MFGTAATRPKSYAKNDKNAQMKKMPYALLIEEMTTAHLLQTEW